MQLRNRRAPLIVGVLLLLTMLVGACSGGQRNQPAPGTGGESKGQGNSPGQPKAGGTLVIARPKDSLSLDPHVQTTAPEVWVYDHIYDTLVVLDEKMQFQPALAESWEIVNPTTWRFKLRQGVKFHDGTPFNAEAVKFNFDRVLNPAKPARGRAWIGPITEARVVDEYTVEIITSTPFGAMLAALSESFVVGMVSPEAVKKHGDAYGRNPVGTGPFKFVEWKSNDQIVLEKYPDYWGAKPYLDKLVFKVIPEEGARMIAFEKGDADVVLLPAATDLARLRSDKSVTVNEVAGLRVFYVGLVHSNPILKDVNVRKALFHAIDVDSIVEFIGEGGVVRAPGFLASGAFGYKDVGLAQRYPYDAKKAQQMLDAAGWKRGSNGMLAKNGKALELNFLSSEGRDFKSKEIAEAIQEQLSKVGVKVNLRIMEWGTFLNETPKADFDQNWGMYTLGWSAITGDGEFGMYSLFHSDPTKDTKPNTGRYVSAEVDKLLDTGRTSSDQQQRQEAYGKAQEILAEELPWIPIWQSSEIRMTKSYVKGFKNHPAEYYLRLGSVWLDK